MENTFNGDYIVVGIDVSTKDFAVVMFYLKNENKQSKKIELKKIIYEKKWSLKDIETAHKPLKASYFLNNIEKIIWDFKGEIEDDFCRVYCFVEQSIFQSPVVFNAIKGGYYQIIGTILSKFYFSTIVDLITPNEWKKAIGFERTFKGSPKYTVKQKKQRTIDFAKKLGYETTDNDLADAFLIGMGGFKKYVPGD